MSLETSKVGLFFEISEPIVVSRFVQYISPFFMN